MANWRNKSKKQRETIKQEFLKFYNKFNGSDCPYLNYTVEHGIEAADRIFCNTMLSTCNICNQLKILEMGDRGCPCLIHGPYKAKKLLKKLLIHWKLIK